MSQLGAHVDWCRHQWTIMADGGTWAVPRSGLIFRKDEGDQTLTLIRQMPWDEQMPMSEGELEAYQESDFTVIREHFAAAGITVTREYLTGRPE